MVSPYERKNKIKIINLKTPGSLGVLYYAFVRLEPPVSLFCSFLLFLSACLFDLVGHASFSSIADGGADCRVFE